MRVRTRLARLFRRGVLPAGAVAIVMIGVFWQVWPRDPKDRVQRKPDAPAPLDAGPSFVEVETLGNGRFKYLVNGKPQVFIGMGYNPIYRYLSEEDRAANYDRDFRILCQAGVNHIIGWDRDKGYDQDKFDQLTLDYAQKYGLGVLMPFYLRAGGNYEDEGFRNALLKQAAEKVTRFKDHPALRMWAAGNELILDGLPPAMMPAFGRFYLELADLIRSLDANHPVIYRESEDFFVPAIVRFLQKRPPERPWLLYGANIYSLQLERILHAWPYYGFDRPLFVTEFGAEPDWDGGRALGYRNMWRLVRSHPDYVMGGAPYAWTTEGPEPGDPHWGLMDGNSQPVDDTFGLLKADWLEEEGALQNCPE